jgi:hypothetical protein
MVTFCGSHLPIGCGSSTYAEPKTVSKHRKYIKRKFQATETYFVEAVFEVVYFAL